MNFAEKEYLNIFRDSIQTMTEERHFLTERGYQGQLLVELNKRMAAAPIYPIGQIIEQEYQKSLSKHNILIRPDIIIHIPYEKGITSVRQDGNFAVIELKLRAYKSAAVMAFKNLDLMFEKLNYHLGIFLNINSDQTFFDFYSGNYKDRLHCFAIELIDKKVHTFESPK